MRIRVIFDKRDAKKDRNVKNFFKEVKSVYKLFLDNGVKVNKHISKVEDAQKILLNLSFFYMRRLLIPASLIDPNKISFYHEKEKLTYRELEYLLLNDNRYL